MSTATWRAGVRRKMECPWPAALDSREFYELMQTYRHTPAIEFVQVNEAYEAVRFYVRDSIVNDDLALALEIIEMYEAVVQMAASDKWETQSQSTGVVYSGETDLADATQQALASAARLIALAQGEES